MLARAPGRRDQPWSCSTLFVVLVGAAGHPGRLGHGLVIVVSLRSRRRHPRLPGAHGEPVEGQDAGEGGAGAARGADRRRSDRLPSTPPYAERSGLIEVWGTLGSLGFLVMLFSGRDQRLGDMAAGALVLRERQGGALRPVELLVPPGCEQLVTTLDVGAMSADDYELVRSFLVRWRDFAGPQRVAVAATVAAPVVAAVQAPPPRRARPRLLPGLPGRRLPVPSPTPVASGPPQAAAPPVAVQPSGATPVTRRAVRLGRAPLKRSGQLDFDRGGARGVRTSSEMFWAARRSSWTRARASIVSAGPRKLTRATGARGLTFASDLARRTAASNSTALG